MAKPNSVLAFRNAIWQALESHCALEMTVAGSAAMVLLHQFGEVALPQARGRSLLSQNLALLQASRDVRRMDLTFQAAKVPMDEITAFLVVFFGTLCMALLAVHPATPVELSFGSELERCLALLPSACPELTWLIHDLLQRTDGDRLPLVSQLDGGPDEVLGGDGDQAYGSLFTFAAASSDEEEDEAGIGCLDGEGLAKDSILGFASDSSSSDGENEPAGHDAHAAPQATTSFAAEATLSIVDGLPSNLVDTAPNVFGFEDSDDSASESGFGSSRLLFSPSNLSSTSHLDDASLAEEEPAGHAAGSDVLTAKDWLEQLRSLGPPAKDVARDEAEAVWASAVAAFTAEVGRARRQAKAPKRSATMLNRPGEAEPEVRTLNVANPLPLPKRARAVTASSAAPSFAPMYLEYQQVARRLVPHLGLSLRDPERSLVVSLCPAVAPMVSDRFLKDMVSVVQRPRAAYTPAEHQALAVLWTIVATIVVGTGYASTAQEAHDLVKLGFGAFRNRPNDNVVSIWNIARHARKQAVVLAIVATYSLLPSLDRPFHKLAEHVRQFKYSDSASRDWTDDGLELASHLQ